MNQKIQEKEKRKNDLVKTIVDVILETGKEPSVKEIVSKSKISRRTLFNYYHNRGDLFKDIGSEVMKRMEDRFLKGFEPKSNSFDAMIEEIITKRIEVYEYLTPIRRIMEQKRLENKDIRKSLRISIDKDIQRLKAKIFVFLKDTENPERVLLMIHTVISWNNWNYLKDEVGLSSNEVREMMLNMAKLIYNSNMQESKNIPLLVK
jgi:AcrR family transcriptional regulator